MGLVAEPNSVLRGETAYRQVGGFIFPGTNVADYPWESESDDDGFTADFSTEPLGGSSVDWPAETSSSADDDSAMVTVEFLGGPMDGATWHFATTPPEQFAVTAGDFRAKGAMYRRKWPRAFNGTFYHYEYVQ